MHQHHTEQNDQNEEPEGCIGFFQIPLHPDIRHREKSNAHARDKVSRNI